MRVTFRITQALEPLTDCFVQIGYRKTDKVVIILSKGAVVVT